MVGSLRCSVTTCARNFDRQKAFFIRHSRKFREASSDQVGTKSFYGGNFREISDDDDAAFDSLRGTLWTHVTEYRCCTLLHINGYERFLKGRCEGRSVEPMRLLRSSSIPVILVSSRIVDTWEARTGKVRSEICLILFGEALRSVSDCLMHSTTAKLSRTPRDQRNWYWLRARPSGLTSDLQWRMI